MRKRHVPHEKEVPISTRKRNRSKSKNKRDKKDLVFEGFRVLRVSFLLFLVGVIVFHYYLITENKLGSYYVAFWKSNKNVLTPIILFFSGSLTLFLTGFWFGKRS